MPSCSKYNLVEMWRVIHFDRICEWTFSRNQSIVRVHPDPGSGTRGHNRTSVTKPTTLHGRPQIFLGRWSTIPCIYRKTHCGEKRAQRGIAGLSTPWYIPIQSGRGRRSTAMRPRCASRLFEFHFRPDRSRDANTGMPQGVDAPSDGAVAVRCVHDTCASQEHDAAPYVVRDRPLPCVDRHEVIASSKCPFLRTTSRWTRTSPIRAKERAPARSYRYTRSGAVPRPGSLT